MRAVRGRLRLIETITRAGTAQRQVRNANADPISGSWCSSLALPSPRWSPELSEARSGPIPEAHVCCALPEGRPVKPQSPPVRPIPQLTHTGSDRARPPPDVTQRLVAALESHLGPGPSAIHLGRVHSLASGQQRQSPTRWPQRFCLRTVHCPQPRGRSEGQQPPRSRVPPEPCSATQASRAPALPRGPGARVQLREPATDWRGNSSAGSNSSARGTATRTGAQRTAQHRPWKQGKRSACPGSGIAGD